MATQYRLPYNGKEYTLEFSRRAVRMLENDGLDVRDVDKKPMDTIYKLFKGSLYKNHGFLSEEAIESMFDSVEDIEPLAEILCKMYEETFRVLSPEGEAKRAAKE